MVVAISTRNHGYFYTVADSISTVKTAVDNHCPLTVSWYNDYGKRFDEEVIFPDDEQVLMLRTESDAPWIELEVQ